MKKFLPIILGLIVGVVVSSGMIHTNKNDVAYGKVTAWNELVAFFDANSIDWNDVFSRPENSQNLYQLIYMKYQVYPEKDALKEVAQAYGLTKFEAKAAVAGNVDVILNNDTIRLSESLELRQNDAYIILDNLQSDYRDMSEMFELEQEIDASITPSAIFANGDITDSGFDLVYDLSIIEEILFVETSETLAGQPFAQELSSPYLPTEAEQTTGTYVGSENAIGVLTFPLEEESNGGAFINENGETVINIGDDEIELDVLDEDICPPEEEGLLASLEEFDDLAQDDEGSDGDENDEGGDGSDDSGGNDEDVGDDDEDDYNIVDENGEINPALADDWSKQWCPGLEDPTKSAVGGSAAAGAVANFSSLGDVENLYVQGVFEAIGEGDTDFSILPDGVGAAATYEEEGVTANASICLTTEYVYETLSSYQPGDSCILCEVEKINAILDETVSHSLVPNKVTGNLMESAKCKDSYKLSGIDMQFIAIAAPIATPSDSEAIFGKNGIEEWNKFVDRYKPLLLPEFDAPTNFLLNVAPSGTTQADILIEAGNVQSAAAAEAMKGVEDYKSYNDGINTMFYSQNVFAEIEQMSAYFKHYKEIFEKIEGTNGDLEENQIACPVILKKPNL